MVDDSVLMRTLISDMLNVPGEIAVVATAKNGIEAIEKTKEYSPDVITMDVEMPKMDGISALKVIMREKPTPVVMLSAVTNEGASATLVALSSGAVDFIPKPSGSISLDIDRVKDTLLTKVRAAYKISKDKLLPSSISYRDAGLKAGKPLKCGSNKVVVIAASTGGPPALEKVLSSLPGDIPAGILIVQHMPPGFTRSFAERLNRVTDIEVKEAEEGDQIVDGLALIAPGNYHMDLKKDKKGIMWYRYVSLNQEPVVHSVRPAADITMRAASEIYGPNTIGVVLTGMGSDGAFGLRHIKACGGRTIACDERTSLIFGMPRAAIELGCVDRIVPLENIAGEIIGML